MTLPQRFREAGYLSVSYGKIFHQKLDDAPSWHRAGASKCGINESAHGNASIRRRAAFSNKKHDGAACDGAQEALVRVVVVWWCTAASFGPAVRWRRSAAAAEARVGAAKG